MAMEYVTATIEDLERIQYLNRLLCEKEESEYKYGINLDWVYGKEAVKYYTEAITEDTGEVFLAKLDGEIIGYLICNFCKSEEYRVPVKSAILDSFFVLEEHRNKGIGAKLYDLFSNWCKENDIKRMKVDVHALNRLGIKFYERAGFKPYTLIMEQDL